MIYAMGLAGLGLAWLLPGHYFPWVSFQQEVLASLGVGLVAVAALVSTDGRKLLWPRVSMASALLALIPLVQWCAGMIPFAADAILPALYLLTFSLSVVAAASVYDAKGATFVAAVFGCFLAAAIASTGIALVQWLRIGDFFLIEQIDGRIYANLTQPNHLASLLGLGIAGLLWFYETRRIGGLTTSLALAFLGFGLVMAQSRTGWLVVVAIILWTVAMRARLSLRTTRVAALVALAAFAVALALWQPLNDLLYLSSPLSLTDRLRDGIRPIMWATLLDAAWRSPWFGYGWEQVTMAQQAAALDHPAAHGGWTNYSHNLLIDLLVWNGIPLGLLVFGAAAGWVISRARACADKDAWAGLVGSTVLFIHAMVEFPLAYLYFLLPLGMMVGIIERRHSELRSAARPQQVHLPRVAFGLTLLFLWGMLAWIWSDYMDVEEAARRVRLKEAGYIADGQVPAVPNVILLDNQREFIRLRLSEAKPGMTPAELDAMRTVVQRFAPPPAMMRYALAAGLNQREAEAERTLQLICKIWYVTHCDQGRAAWTSAQQKFEALRGIPFPGAETAPTKAAGTTRQH